MQIRVIGSGGVGLWEFEIVAKNKKVVAISNGFYASRRNAISAAKLIAGSKLKVVVEA